MFRARFGRGDAFGHGFLLLGEKGSHTDGVGDEVEGRAFLVLYKLSDGSHHSSSADGKKLAGFVDGTKTVFGSLVASLRARLSSLSRLFFHWTSRQIFTIL